MKQLNTTEYEELLNKLKENTLCIKFEVDNLLSNSCCEYHRAMFGIASNPEKRKEWQEKVEIANKVKNELEQATILIFLIDCLLCFVWKFFNQTVLCQIILHRPAC